MTIDSGRRACAALTMAAMLNVASHAESDIERATTSATTAGYSLDKVHRWLHEIALPRIDAGTGLYRADGKWNYRDTAADCYPFLAWAAHVVDLEVLNGPVRQVLHREQALCNSVGEIPVPWDFESGAQVQDLAWDEVVFQASEYVKDGLIAIVEVTGRDEWFDRMRAIEDALWETARVDTPVGKIPSTNIEVNGEQLQALARLYSMTGDEKYLDWGDRLADYYFADEKFEVKRLRDHGCEIIGGLGLLHAVESTHRPERARQYGPRLEQLYEDILKRGCNEDGIMYDEIDKREGRLSDGWGYNYVGYLCHDLALDVHQFDTPITSVLRSLSKPAYANYPWEGESIDGYADSIEGAIYLLNRLPVQEAFDWVDQETRANLLDHPSRLENGELWGTMKLQSNAVRTVLMHALMHTKGIIARPWQPGLQLGAALDGDKLTVVMSSPVEYRGVLEFDLPRHREYMGFDRDWPRMNTLPEWHTVKPDVLYTVQSGEKRAYTGRQLHAGLAVSVAPGETNVLVVEPVMTGQPVE